jgi:hypothetical protein
MDLRRAPILFRRRDMKKAMTHSLSIGLAAMLATAFAPLAQASNGLESQKSRQIAMADTAKKVAQPAQQAPAPKPPAAQIQMPPPEAMIIMIRSSLVALSQANTTNNYAVLNALGSDSFRQANPPARLAQIFAPFRTNNIDLAPVVFVTPQLSQQPKIENGRLHLVGYFPTQPMQVLYDVQYEPSGGVWKLYGLSVNLNPAQQQQQNAAPGRGAAPSGR